jgi:hypothetical protein
MTSPNCKVFAGLADFRDVAVEKGYQDEVDPAS